MSENLNNENLKLIRLYKETKEQKQKDIILKRILTVNEPIILKVISAYPINIQEDLRQECYIALYKAIEDFDLSYNNNFLTYAKYKILFYTRDSRLKQSHTNSTIYSQRVISAYNKCKDKSKDIEEIAKEINVKPNTLINALQAQNPILYLEDIQEDIFYPELEKEYDYLVKEKIKQAILSLTDKEQFVVNNFFGFGTESKTLEKIGLLMNPQIKTRQRVHSICQKAIEKIKRQLINEGIE